MAEIDGGFFDDGLELVDCNNDDAGLIIEFFGKGGFDFGGEFWETGFGRVKDNITALDVGFDFAEAEGFETYLEVGHFDNIVAADIDAAKEGEVVRHGYFCKRKFFGGRACRCDIELCSCRIEIVVEVFQWLES